MENSSKTDMKEVFGYLENIKKIEPNANLFSNTLNKINKQNVIPIFWVRAVACIFFAFISIEFYFSMGKIESNSKDVSIVIYNTKNTLYNE